MSRLRAGFAGLDAAAQLLANEAAADRRLVAAAAAGNASLLQACRSYIYIYIYII